MSREGGYRCEEGCGFISAVEVKEVGWGCSVRLLTAH